MDYYKERDIISERVMHGSPCLSCEYDVDGECAIRPGGMCKVVELTGNEFAIIDPWGLPVRGF